MCVNDMNIYIYIYTYIYILVRLSVGWVAIVYRLSKTGMPDCVRDKTDLPQAQEEQTTPSSHSLCLVLPALPYLAQTTRQPIMGGALRVFIHSPRSGGMWQRLDMTSVQLKMVYNESERLPLLFLNFELGKPKYRLPALPQ